MSKTALIILVFLGVVVLYFLSLIVVTIIMTNILIKSDPDDIDYAMTANAIQFFVIVAVIAEKVARWIN